MSTAITQSKGNEERANKPNNPMKREGNKKPQKYETKRK